MLWKISAGPRGGTARPDLRRWEELIRNVRNPESTVTIAMVGKYVDLTEAYKSLNEALAHAGFPIGARVEIEYVDSEKFEDPHVLAHADAVLVPHGFRGRGAEGKLKAVRFARENGIPYLGIC